MIIQKAINLEALTDLVSKRFWSKVDKSGDCWLWQAAKMKDGYGRFRLGDGHYPAHRIAYALANKVDPGHLLVCHSCDVPGCTNPDHLFLGDALINSKDMIRKGRNANLSGERSGTADLDNAGAKRVRELNASGAYTFSDLAVMFRTKKHTIQRIVTGMTYQDAGGPVVKVNRRCQKGENNGRSKLTEELVIAARELHSVDGCTIETIANVLGVSRFAVSDAVYYRTWKHI